MAKEIQVKLPIQLKPLFDDLKKAKADRLESTTIQQTVIDAIKNYHAQLCK